MFFIHELNNSSFIPTQTSSIIFWPCKQSFILQSSQALIHHPYCFFTCRLTQLPMLGLRSTSLFWSTFRIVSFVRVPGILQVIIYRTFFLTFYQSSFLSIYLPISIHLSYILIYLSINSKYLFVSHNFLMSKSTVNVLDHI